MKKLTERQMKIIIDSVKYCNGDIGVYSEEDVNAIIAYFTKKLSKEKLKGEDHGKQKIRN